MLRNSDNNNFLSFFIYFYLNDYFFEVNSLLCVGDGWGDQRLILRTTNGSVTISAWTLHRNGSDLKKTLGDIDAEDHMTFVIIQFC